MRKIKIPLLRRWRSHHHIWTDDQYSMWVWSNTAVVCAIYAKSSFCNFLLPLHDQFVCWHPQGLSFPPSLILAAFLDQLLRSALKVLGLLCSKASISALICPSVITTLLFRPPFAQLFSGSSDWYASFAALTSKSVAVTPFLTWFSGSALLNLLIRFVQNDSQTKLKSSS